MVCVTAIITIFTITCVSALSAFSINRGVANTSKTGLAWPNGDSVDLGQYRTTGKVSWYYTWSPFSIDTDLEFVAMLWGQKSVDQFSSTINDTIAKRGVKAILGMNEPQEPGQSNLTAEQGAEMWKAYLEPLRSQGIRLGSPAPSSAPSGKIWLQDFLVACAGACTVDFIALHYYDVNATQFKEYLTDYHQTFQRPLWVTEWACQNFNDLQAQCSKDDVVLFLNETQIFMDNSDFVERYAWFGAMRDMSGVNQADALMDSGGKINALGKQYIGSEPPQTSGGGNADGPMAPGGRDGGVSISSSSSKWIGFRATNAILLFFAFLLI
ncbi:glycosyl hydrolase catalytic core-domain-containing protein [Collybia nuda]|uniref:Glycosyl hydrolase catalytic core-domain-containing protein n=1 Tax=Collybia nuda TaxID=64659 RepID=A0A9P6CMK2_9AGAR|nr:glycosyl hydrolase catalytic core-domain-containing protein [Collybia nuda]